MTDLRATLMLCAYRGLSIPTLDGVLEIARDEEHWAIRTVWNDALISRARSRIVSMWFRETGPEHDVFLMVDDDIVFSRAEADRLVERCRSGFDICAAGVPSRRDDCVNVVTDDARGIMFGPNEQPSEIQWAGTGFLAVHRRVIEAMMPTMQLCYPDSKFGFWPFFATQLAQEVDQQGRRVMVYLSEDWAFSHRARKLGLRIWVDPAVHPGHLAPVELTAVTQHRVWNALNGPGPRQQPAHYAAVGTSPREVRDPDEHSHKMSTPKSQRHLAQERHK